MLIFGGRFKTKSVEKSLQSINLSGKNRIQQYTGLCSFNPYNGEIYKDDQYSGFNWFGSNRSS